MNENIEINSYDDEVVVNCPQYNCRLYIYQGPSINLKDLIELVQNHVHDFTVPQMTDREQRAVKYGYARISLTGKYLPFKI